MIFSAMSSRFAQGEGETAVSVGIRACSVSRVMLLWPYLPEREHLELIQKPCFGSGVEAASDRFSDKLIVQST